MWRCAEAWRNHTRTRPATKTDGTGKPEQADRTHSIILMSQKHVTGRGQSKTDAMERRGGQINRHMTDDEVRRRLEKPCKDHTSQTRQTEQANQTGQNRQTRLVECTSNACSCPMRVRVERVCTSTASACGMRFRSCRKRVHVDCVFMSSACARIACVRLCACFAHACALPTACCLLLASPLFTFARTRSTQPQAADLPRACYLPAAC